MQVLTNFCVFIIFVGQGAKIFIVYNIMFLTHVMLYQQHLFSQFFSFTVPLEERYRDFTVMGKASSVTAGTQ